MVAEAPKPRSPFRKRTEDDDDDGFEHDDGDGATTTEQARNGPFRAVSKAADAVASKAQKNVKAVGSEVAKAAKLTATGIASATASVPGLVKKRKGVSEEEKEVREEPTADIKRKGVSEEEKVEEEPTDDGNESMSLLSPSSQSQMSNGPTKTIVVGPVIDFLTADTTVLLIFTLCIAIHPTYHNWESVKNGQIPFSVAGSWLLVSYSLGNVFSLSSWWKTRFVMIGSGGMLSQESTLLDDGDNLPTEVAIVQRQSVSLQEVIQQQQKRQKHTLLLKALSGTKVKFSSAVIETLRKARAWTSLNSKRSKKFHWEKDLDPSLDKSRNRDLMKRLLRNRKLRKMRKSELYKKSIKSIQITQDAEYVVEGKGRPLGQFVLPEASSLEEFVIVPLLKLRGMDVFLTENAENEVSTHPWLIEQGLRDVPTFFINAVTQWGNILIYFELPAWVTSWDLTEKDDDEDDVRAMKRFFNRDDEYRNLRMKIIPSLVDGPLAVKVLAPPMKEKVVSSDSLPVRWMKYDAEVDSRGRKLKPAIEAILDCLSSPSVRLLTGIVKRNFKRVSVDIAVLIQKPDDQDVEEPQACLGMWRFHYVDISMCPDFPDRFAVESAKEGQDPDVYRASTIVRMSSKEVTALASCSRG